MKKFTTIAALTLAASALWTAGHGAGDTSVNTSVNTSINTSDNTNTPTDTSDTPAGTNAPVNTSANTPINAPADTSINTDTSANINTPTGTSINTPINTPPADIPINSSGNIYHDTLLNASASTAPLNTNTPANTPVNTPADTSVNTDKPTDTAINSVNAEKIFLLPPYTFHIVFLVASVALIAATLYFFLARRNNDSRRFLTTTRLSVLDKLVQRGCRHIESNYPDPALTPETVCNSLVTGKAYLDALFTNELGINVQDFIVQVRVNAIKNRLTAPQEQPSPNIDDICADCGFADRAEAERCFSAVSGGVGITEFIRFAKMQNQRRC